MRKLRTNILTPLDQDELQYLPDHTLAWEQAKIQQLRPYNPALDADAEDLRDCLVLPGFVDVHVHLSQYRIRGRYEPDLLTWLDRHVFPEEARSADGEYAKKLSAAFFEALFAAGTTTAVIYTAPFQQACETAFATAAELGARAFIGMTLMDRDSPPNLIQTTDYAFSRSTELYSRYHGVSPLMDYIFTPRFALTCSERLLSALAVYAAGHEAWIQTHLSENPAELRRLSQISGGRSYTRYYADLGLLTPRSILAHAIHLSDAEKDLLAEQGCRIAHCPDSNFFLKSGEFDYPGLHARHIPIGIGSDVAAGTSLSMPYHARMANYRQSSQALSPARLLWHITLGNARLLDLDKRVGSVETGKEADLVILRLPPDPVDPELLSAALCFCGEDFPVQSTIVAGRKVWPV